MNIYTAFIFTILSVKMWRIVFVVEHSDNNSEKTANLRHIDFGVSIVQT